VRTSRHVLREGRCNVVASVRPLGLKAALAALALVAAMPAPASAQGGLFEQLFGGRQQRSYETQFGNAYADPYGAPDQAQPAPAAPPSTGRIVSYCVRTCDGRYFPMHRTSNANPIQLCSSFCPASKTQVFTGSEINYAAAANGARYADSENAFVYRKQIVPGCTCNGRDAFGLAPIDLASDPTIKQGDIVVTAQGPVSLRGNKWARAALDLRTSVPLAAAPAREPVEPGDQSPNAND
jgi:hypothetical protein